MSPTLCNIDEDGFLYYSNLLMLTHSRLSCHLLTIAISYFLVNITPYRNVGGMDVHFLKFLVSAFTFANWPAVETNNLFTHGLLGRRLGGPQKQPGYLTDPKEQSPCSVRHGSPTSFYSPVCSTSSANHVLFDFIALIEAAEKFKS